MVGYSVAKIIDWNRRIQSGQWSPSVTLGRIVSEMGRGLPISIPESDQTRLLEESTMGPRSTKRIGTVTPCWGRGCNSVILSRSLLLLSCCCTSLAGCISQPAAPELTDPPPVVTLLVTNATCSSGQCSSFQIRGYPIPLNQPSVPGGWSEDLGDVSTESACLTMHAADTFRVMSEAVPTVVEGS